MSESNTELAKFENNDRNFEEQNVEGILLNREYLGEMKPNTADNCTDLSPSGSVFESEDCYTSIFENDQESGVESVDGDWLQSCNTPPSEFDLDLTEEQALETLKYFSKYDMLFLYKNHILHK